MSHKLSDVELWKAELRMRPAPERFRHFVRAREDARLVKELLGGPGPHSEDPIIAVNRFCNVDREDDAVTKWVAKHVREEYAPCFPSFMVVQVLAARIWNHPPTLEEILPVSKFADEQAEVLRKLLARRARGEKTMRGAYMMPVHGNNGRGKSVDEYYLAAVAEAHTVDWEKFESFAEVAGRLTQILGIGEFLANQVVADLRHCPHWRDMPDRSTFVLCGPGSRRGIDRYDGQPQDKQFGGRAQKWYVERLLTIRQELLDDYFFNTTFYDPNNVSNCFCEFDKYERVLHGEAKRLHSYP